YITLRSPMTSVANLISAAAATEQRNPVTLGNTIPVGQPADPTSTCDSQLSTDPWEIDTQPGYGPGASTNDTSPANTPHQLPIPGGSPGGSTTDTAPPTTPALLRTPADNTRRTQQAHVARFRTAEAHVGAPLKILGPVSPRVEIRQHADFAGYPMRRSQAAR